MVPARKITTDRQIFAVSILGAMVHNLGQILVAVAVTATPGLFVYLPLLLASGIVTGAFTGLAAQSLTAHLRRLGMKFD